MSSKLSSDKELLPLLSSLPPPSTGPTTLPPILPSESKQHNNRTLIYLPSIFNDFTSPLNSKRKHSSSSVSLYPTTTFPSHTPMHTVYRRDSSASASESDGEPSAVFSRNSFSDLSNNQLAPHYRITTNSTTTTDLSSRPLSPNFTPSSPIHIHTGDSTLLISQLPPSNRRGVPRSGLRHSCKYPECGWSFKRFEHLKRHMMTHSGEKPFMCEFPGCGKSFGRSDNFHAHARTHNLHPLTENSTSASEQEKKRPRLNSTVSLPPCTETQRTSTSPAPASASPSKSASIKMLLNEEDPVTRSDDLATDPADDERNAAALCLASLPFAAQRNVTGLTLTTDNPPLSPTSTTTLTPPSTPSGSPTNYDGMYNTFLNRSTPVQQRRSLPMDFYLARNEYEVTSSTLFNNENLQVHSRPSFPTGIRSKRTANSSDAVDPSKPHICTHPSGCTRRFKRREHLRRHSRTHTDEKPFVCPTCSKSFSRSDNLNQHAKTHGMHTSIVTSSPRTGLQRSASMTSFTSSPSSAAPLGTLTESSHAEYAS